MKPQWFLILTSLWLLASPPAMAQGVPNIYAPLYGNWCGPNHPVDMSRAGPPLDQLDAACMRHDQCFAALGDQNCNCDISLLNELRTTAWPNPVIDQNARAVYDAIALVPCNSLGGTTQKQTMFAVDLAYDVISGRGTPMDVLERWRYLLLGPSQR